MCTCTCTDYIRQLAPQDPCWLRLETPIGIGFSLCFQETEIAQNHSKSRNCSLTCCCDVQSKLVARVLSGKAHLPSPREMIQDVEDFYQLLIDSNVPVRYTHNQVSAQSHNMRVVLDSDYPVLRFSYAVRTSVGTLKTRSAHISITCGCCFGQCVRSVMLQLHSGDTVVTQ